jgi:hypothetical protein
MKKFLLVISILLTLNACSPQEGIKTLTSSEIDSKQLVSISQSIPTRIQETEGEITTSQTITSTPTSIPSTPLPAEDKYTSAPSPTLVDQKIGPDSFPEGVNPLTGLAAEDQNFLNLPPALVSVANFPVSARPQAGLSFSPIVFEMYIGEGMTRFLALFYGEYPRLTNTDANLTSATELDNANIGPIRSGRLPYESIQKLYNGFLVMASAYRAVSEKLGFATNIYGSDEDDINSALIDVSKLQAIAENSADKDSMNLTGNQFSPKTPSGGQSASRLWIFYNYLNQIDWRYEPAQGAYLRFQDEANGAGTFIPSTDRLTGEQLAFENVILLFAKHKVLNSERTLIDVELLYTGNLAYLFRDGQVFPIYWNTMNGEYEKTSGLLRPIRFTDRSGKPISLKPGQTWVEMVDMSTTLQEIEAGAWKARFYAP